MNNKILQHSVPTKILSPSLALMRAKVWYRHRIRFDQHTTHTSTHLHPPGSRILILFNIMWWPYPNCYHPQESICHYTFFLRMCLPIWFYIFHVLTICCDVLYIEYLILYSSTYLMKEILIRVDNKCLLE